MRKMQEGMKFFLYKLVTREATNLYSAKQMSKKQ